MSTYKSGVGGSIRLQRRLTRSCRVEGHVSCSRPAWSNRYRANADIRPMRQKTIHVSSGAPASEACTSVPGSRWPTKCRFRRWCYTTRNARRQAGPCLDRRHKIIEVLRRRESLSSRSEASGCQHTGENDNPIQACFIRVSSSVVTPAGWGSRSRSPRPAESPDDFRHSYGTMLALGHHRYL